MGNPEMFLDGSHGSLVKSLAEKELFLAMAVGGKRRTSVGRVTYIT